MALLRIHTLIGLVVGLSFASVPTLSEERNLPSLTTFESWQVPWENTRPRDPGLDSQGNVWFCGQTGNYIAKLDPDTGQFQRFALPDSTHPHNLIVDKSDHIWYAGNKNAHIGRLDPATGEIQQFPMPNSDAADPHTLVFDAKENIWFTVQLGNYIGYLQTQSGEVTLFKVPTARARPYGIKLTGSGQPWAVLLGTNQLATVIDGKLITVEIPRENARPRRLEITADGKIWYADYAGGYLGSYNPNNSQFEEWLMPTGEESYPYATALDSKGRIWLSDTSKIPNQYIGFDTKSKAFISQTEVSFGGHIRHTFVNPATDEVWFGTDTGYVAKAKGVD